MLTREPALAWHSWLIGAATIALAGAFQFSKLKHRCLDKCRTPLSFVIEHWRGQAQSRHAFMLGADQVYPLPDTAASTGPIQGSLILFRLTNDSLQNRPLRLEIEQEGVTNPKAEIELDL